MLNKLGSLQQDRQPARRWRLQPLRPRLARWASSTEAADLHRLAFEIKLAACSKWQRVWALCFDRLFWPLMSLQLLLKVPRSLRRSAAAHAQTSRARHFIETWTDCARLGTTPKEYLKFGLSPPALKMGAADYIYPHEVFPIWSELIKRADQGEINLMQDKAEFCRFCESRNIPVPELLAEADQGHIQYEIAPDSPRWSCDLLMKPLHGSNGVGVYVWEKNDDGYVGLLGEVVSREAIFEQLAVASRRRSIIVQRRIVNDAESKQFTGGGLATARIVTGQFSNGEIGLIAAAFKMPVGRSPSDNYMRGNVLAQVSAQTGTLLPGQWFHDRLKSIENHPDTGIRFAGKRVPQWDEIIQLSISTHHHFCGLPIIGFDIAPTPHGPVVIEANTRPDLAMIQYPGGQPLGTTLFPRVVLSYLRSMAG